MQKGNNGSFFHIISIYVRMKKVNVKSILNSRYISSIKKYRFNRTC